MEADKTIKLFEKLEADKSPMMALWQETGEFVYPSVSNFSRYYDKGLNKRRMIFDGTAERALEIFAASMIGLVANPASKWINYQPADSKLVDDREVQLFIDEAQKKVLSVFNNPNTKFYDNLFVALQMIGAYGTGSLFIEEDKDHVARFRAESPKGLNFTEDFTGSVEDVYFIRKYKFKQLDDSFELPANFGKREPEDEVEVLRVIKKNPKYDPRKLGVEFAKYHSFYYLKQENFLMKKAFFNTMPAPIGRWGRIDDEKWGDSPARVALADIKMLNASQKGMMVAMEKQLKPTLAISSGAKFGKFDNSAGAVNVGRGNLTGAIQKIDTTGNFPIVFEWQQSIAAAIRSAFYIDVFQTAENIDITATEANIRYAEKLRTIAPRAAKLQSDLLGPAAERVLYLLISQGKIQVPEALKNQEIRVVYISPLAQAQRAQEATSILQFTQEAGLIAQLKPEVLDLIDGDAIIKELGDIRGIPEKILRDAESVKAIREQKAQQAQAQNALALAQQAGDAGQSLNAAQQQ